MQQQNWWDEAPVVSQPQPQQQAPQGDDWWQAAPVVSAPRQQQGAAPVAQSASEQNYGGDYDPMTGQAWPDDGIPMNPDLTAQMAQPFDDGSTRDSPIDITGRLYQDQIDRLKQGAWVRAQNGEVYQLPGDAFTSTTRPSDEAQGGNVYVRRPNLEDRIGAASTAFVEQVPGGDEALAAITGALSGQGYDAARESQMVNRELLNQTNRGDRNIGGVAGAVIPAFALPGAGWINGAQGVGRVGRAAAVGAGYGAGYGFGNTDGDLSQRLQGAGTGAAVGGVSGFALQGLGNAFSRSGANAVANPSPQRQLSQMGVELTPGQMAGGAVQRIEDGLTSMPILGDSIRNAQRRGLESMNVAAYNDALEPISRRLARGVSGREAYGMAEDLVGQAYDNALGGVVVNPANGFDQAIQSVRAKPLPGSIQDTITGVVDDFANRFSQPLSGQEFKQLDSEVGAAIRSAQSGAASDPSKRLVADRLSEIRDGLNASLQAADPFAAADKSAADSAFARLVRLRDAQQSLGTAAREDGIFTAGDLNRAVRNGDTSAGNRQYARGDALGQRLSELSAQVLPSRVPDSGSIFRSIVNIPTLGGGAFLTTIADPTLLSAGLAGGGLATGAYSRLGQDALNAAYRAHAPGAVRRATGGLFGRAAPRSAAIEQSVLQQLLNRPRDDQALLPAR